MEKYLTSISMNYVVIMIIVRVYVWRENYDVHRIVMNYLEVYIIVQIILH